jgi:hypothetical protein
LTFQEGVAAFGPSEIKHMREILLAAKNREDASDLTVLKTY